MENHMIAVATGALAKSLAGSTKSVFFAKSKGAQVQIKVKQK